VRSTAAPYTESRLTHLVRNKCVGFPVVEQLVLDPDPDTGEANQYLHSTANRIRNTIKEQCCGSGMFIPDPDFCPSRIQKQQ
jgi:hypothetical protein